MNKWFIIVGIVVCASLGWWFFFGADTDTTQSNEPRTIIDGETVTIIAFGDSLTAGYGLSQSESYPAQLEKALIQKGYPVSVINAGVSGETTRGSLERAAFIAQQESDIVLLGIGGNDALRALSVDQAKANILETITILSDTENPPVIILLEMQAPLNAGFAYKKEFDSMYEEIADQQDLQLIPFITKDLFLDPENKLSDGIHYNALGYQKVVEQYLLPSLEDVLEGFEK